MIQTITSSDETGCGCACGIPYVGPFTLALTQEFIRENRLDLACTTGAVPIILLDLEPPQLPAPIHVCESCEYVVVHPPGFGGPQGPPIEPL